MFVIQKRTLHATGLITILLIIINFYTTNIASIDFEYSSMLIAFVLSTIIILFHKQNGILSIFVFVKSLILFYFYDPINEGDSLTYYTKAIEFTKDGNFIGILYEAIIGGIYSIVESVSIVYSVVMVWLKTDEPYILLYFNHMLFFFSTVIFVNLLLKQNILSKKYSFIFLIILNLSPLINKYISFVLKESIVIFLIISFVYLLINKRNKILVFSIVIFGSLMRPYFLFYALGILLLIDINYLKKKTIYIIVLFELILFYLYGIIFTDVSFFTYIKNIILSFLGIILSPNFLRPENWINFPLMTFESLFIACTWLLLLVNKSLFKLFRTNILLSMLLFSISLGAVSANRGAVNTGQGHFLVAENIARKKVSIDFINYYIVMLVFFRRREL